MYWSSKDKNQKSDQVMLWVMLSPDGILASSHADGNIRLWEIASGKNLLTLKGHFSFIFGLAISSDGKILATGGHDNLVKFWDVKTGECIQTLDKHVAPIWSVSFSPDGNTGYYSMSRPPSTGGWRIQGNQYCSVWPPSDRWECYDVLLDARSTQTLPVIIWRSARGGEDVSAILSGDQTNGRTPDSVRAIGK